MLEMVLGLGMWEVRASVIRVPLLMVLVLYKWTACPPPRPHRGGAEGDS